MSRRVPFATEVAVIRTRLEHTLLDTAAKHGLTVKTVKAIVDRNPDIVARMQKEIITQAAKKSV